MSNLTKEQIKALKQQAHHLKPVILMGEKGLTEAVQKEIGVALKAHELIKIHIHAEDHEGCNALCEAICQYHGATQIQQIGHMLTIFRPKQ